jgi:hypothetical protein
MSNSENNDDLINRINDRSEQEIASVLQEKQLKAKWREEIIANTSAMNYLKSKGEYAIESFISYYINKKHIWYTNKSSKKDKTIEEQWIEKCQDHLIIMIRKKIVDLQCLWNANLIKVPQVETSADFNFAFGDPLNCTFIEPLTHQEIKMYQDFLLQDDIILDELNTLEFWFYDKLIRNHHGNDSDEDEQSAWYEYHYQRTGTKNLLDLPSIRKEKERFYYKLAQQEKEANQPPVAPIAPVLPSDDRPFLNYYKPEIIKSFVTQFETPEYQKKHKYYTLEHKEETRYNFRTQYYFDQMIAQQEYIPMKANTDFIAAINQSYNDYSIAKLVAALPHAHKQYLHNTKHGLHKIPEQNIFSFRMEKDKKMILDGRVLNGEPRDFNF